MAKQDNRTAFQRLTDVMIGVNGSSNKITPRTVTYNMTPSSEVLYTFPDKASRDQKLAELRQQKLNAYQWKKSGYDTTMEQLAGATQVRVMYRDADLMDQWPEIARALDIYSEEACCLKKGKILNIYSKSPRIQSILEDLFVNRLNIHVMLPEVVRETCKYGNDFRLLNIDSTEGVLGWRQLPVHQMRRIENGMENIYGGGTINANLYNLKPDETKFVWEGHNEQMPFRNWQIAHFRMIRNAQFLPYGVSQLNSARRYWRILSMMEDGMLLHHLDKSIERRIFKVNVGAIDEADVPAFLQDFANTFKRAPMIDPTTGQIDLRKNFLDVSADYFIPVRSGQDPTSIDTLQSANSQIQLDDVNYMQNKVFAAMGVPKSFLNYQEPQGKAQNLSLQDIRFCRSVNYLQQVVLMELNKVAIIHLYLLGFVEDLTNFTLTMNNPSNQIELMELENMTKRLTNATTALAEQGGGIPLMSWHEVQKEIMGKTDAEIATLLNEIRLEKAIAAELQLTSQIIKKTNLFDKIDRIYGEPGAKYNYNAAGQDGDMGGGMGGGGGAMPPMDAGFGDDLGGDIGGEMSGAEGSMDLGGAPEGDMGGAEGAPMENIHQRDGRKLLSETIDGLLNEYKNLVLKVDSDDEPLQRPKSMSSNFLLNEEFNSSIKEINSELEKIEKQGDKFNNLLD